MRQIYADASALVKLGVVEPETDLITRLLASAHVYTSVVGRVELERVLRRHHDPSHAHELSQTVLANVNIVPLDVAVAASASIISPPLLRTLDAIHLATARALLPDLDECYCYDERLSQGMREAGLVVRAPQ